MGNPAEGGVDETKSAGFLYTALKLQGIETKYVYYPDEGHVLQHVANQRDALGRTVDWVDRHLR